MVRTLVSLKDGAVGSSVSSTSELGHCFTTDPEAKVPPAVLLQCLLHFGVIPSILTIRRLGNLLVYLFRINSGRHQEDRCR